MFELHTRFDDPEASHPKISPFWGTIYIKTDSTSFPCDNWYDALSAVLSMWLFETAVFISKKRKTAYKLYFMDGPYCIRLSPAERDNVISAELISNNTVINAIDKDIYFQEFIQQMLDTSQILLADRRTHKFIAASNELRQAREALLNAMEQN